MFKEIMQTLFVTFLPILAGVGIFGAFRAWQVFHPRKRGGRS